MEPILVTGGSGTLGRAVVRRLFDLGHPVRGLTRQGSRPGPAAWFTGDLTTGAGLERAVEGTSAVIHCASDPRRPEHDVEGTARLIEVARRGGVSHLVYISIVGIDRVPLGYYRAKLRVERLVEDSGLPWTILRATQFHDLVLGVLRGLARLPVLPVPAGIRLQPVDAGEVAARLVELAADGPRGRAPDLGGPEARGMGDLARTYLRAARRRRPVLTLPVPGRAARAVRDGALLVPGRAGGRRTWDAFLAERLAVAPAPAGVAR
jgi:uncharacterized protein YbjT (DUF2867 family)